ncbi:hypothetical protein SAMD00019534_110470 [Acytostelium subglobosum LB1]|uniref:hypothetical protein n=1 Tax=Acytostelium subglobosum LB1 TaxID=1410327 RepID=UPI000644FE46|nr:hypothetical protein SAMD00019534_110470 [Acytostelium subglobosum LB1]GAM27871.1 hypothetical protein SAMD00019534_110470 [Acytostelium subglobosum LB1]|eukprot:XP_012749154.1 hypothetical protein SAMD00019534_110470 [Acytostelium subglobosum LB1]
MDTEEDICIPPQDKDQSFDSISVTLDSYKDEEHEDIEIGKHRLPANDDHTHTSTKSKTKSKSKSESEPEHKPEESHKKKRKSKSEHQPAEQPEMTVTLTEYETEPEPEPEQEPEPEVQQTEERPKKRSKKSKRTEKEKTTKRQGQQYEEIVIMVNDDVVDLEAMNNKVIDPITIEVEDGASVASWANKISSQPINSIDIEQLQDNQRRKAKKIDRLVEQRKDTSKLNSVLAECLNNFCTGQLLEEIVVLATMGENCLDYSKEQLNSVATFFEDIIKNKFSM